MALGILHIIAVGAICTGLGIATLCSYKQLFNPTDPEKVFFKISTRGKCDREISVKNLEAIEFNPDLPTYVIIHGYPLSAKKPTYLQDLRDSLLRREDSNVIVVDYLKLTNLHYTSKAKIMPEVVGNKIASVLKELQKEKGLDLNTTNLIGYSIGAHIAGVVGKEVDGIGTITALDPADPKFRGNSSDVHSRRLNKSDAKRVIVHSTNSDGLYHLGHSGITSIRINFANSKFHIERSADLGHVTIAYNEGMLGQLQPGCVIVDFRCHHKRAVSYFNSSICGPDVLLYKTRKQANEFVCENGVPFSQVTGQLNGTFFVKTSEKYPYFLTQPSYHGVGCRICSPSNSALQGTRTKCLPPDSVCDPAETN